MFPEELLLELIGIENPYWVEAYLALNTNGVPELRGEIKQEKDSLRCYHKFTYTKEGWK